MKNKKGGKNQKKQKKASSSRRELVFRENEQYYARLIKPLGDGRFECECFELGETKIAHIRGTFRRRVWMGIGDIVLISYRDFDDSKCDIIYKYTIDEAIALKSFGEIPDNVNLLASNMELANGEGDVDPDGFIFDEI